MTVEPGSEAEAACANGLFASGASAVGDGPSTSGDIGVKAEPEVDGVPAEPEVDDAPAEPEVDDAPDEPEVDDAPAEPEVDGAPAEPEVDGAPAEPSVDDEPDEPGVDDGVGVGGPADPAATDDVAELQGRDADAALVDPSWRRTGASGGAPGRDGASDDDGLGPGVSAGAVPAAPELTGPELTGPELTGPELAADAGEEAVCDVPEACWATGSDPALGARAGVPLGERSGGAEPERSAVAVLCEEVRPSRCRRRTVEEGVPISGAGSGRVDGRVDGVAADRDSAAAACCGTATEVDRPARAATIAVSGNRPAATTSSRRRTRAASDTRPATIPPGVQVCSFATAWAARGRPRRGSSVLAGVTAWAGSAAPGRCATCAHQWGGATAAWSRDGTRAAHDGANERRTPADRPTDEANIWEETPSLPMTRRPAGSR